MMKSLHHQDAKQQLQIIELQSELRNATTAIEGLQQDMDSLNKEVQTANPIVYSRTSLYHDLRIKTTSE